MGFPLKSLALAKTDGEWILTEYSDGRIQVKLFGDSHGRKIVYWLKGRLEYSPDETWLAERLSRRIQCWPCLVASLCFMVVAIVGTLWLVLR